MTEIRVHRPILQIFCMKLKLKKIIENKQNIECRKREEKLSRLFTHTTAAVELFNKKLPKSRHVNKDRIKFEFLSSIP